MKTLEIDLGKDLFDRQGKRLVLNDFGLMVKDYATKIFRQSDEMIQALSSDQMQFKKNIRIGVVPWVPKTFLYEVIRPLLINPYLQVETLEAGLGKLAKDLISGEVDMVLSDAPYGGKSKKLSNIRLRSEEILCVAAKKLKLRGDFPDVLEGKRLINFPENCLSSDKVYQFLEKKKVDYEVAGDFHALELMLEVVERGAAIGFFPKSYVSGAIKKKGLVELGVLEKARFSYWAIVSKDLNEDSLIRDIMSDVRKG